jgi:hypothetical protein
VRDSFKELCIASPLDGEPLPLLERMLHEREMHPLYDYHSYNASELKAAANLPEYNGQQWRQNFYFQPEFETAGDLRHLYRLRTRNEQILLMHGARDRELLANALFALHRHCSHPDYEYDNISGHKDHIDSDDTPEGEGWVVNYTFGYDGDGYTRDDNEATIEWMRLKPGVVPVTDPMLALVQLQTKLHALSKHPKFEYVTIKGPLSEVSINPNGDSDPQVEIDVHRQSRLPEGMPWLPNDHLHSGPFQITAQGYTAHFYRPLQSSVTEE